MRFPLPVASQFFIHIKMAADDLPSAVPGSTVPAYAPPDTTGQLEGQFAAPVEQVIEAVVSSIENELKTGYAYKVYANTLRDFSHHAIAEEFDDHAADELEHADFLMRRLTVMAGSHDLPPIPPPPTLTDPSQILQTMLRIEQEGIAKWRVLRTLVGDEHPMRFKIEEYLTKELEHLDEVVQMLPPELRLASSQPVEKAAGDKGKKEKKDPRWGQAARGALVGGLAGTAVTGLVDGATDGKSRNWIVPGMVGGALINVARNHDKEAQLFLPKHAAEPMAQTAIPNALTPSVAGSLASIATGEPAGQAQGPTENDVPEEGADDAPLLPSTVSPEDIDPALLLHMKQEEAGRQQEEQSASTYFSQQAEQNRQQADMFQQQLMQKDQDLQQMQTQLEAVQSQLQQTQAMVQQSSDTATQALQTQLQTQQVALQARQQTTQVLQMSDGLRQQIRELIDPAPPPPDPNTDPVSQATGQLPQGMTPYPIPGGQPTQGPAPQQPQAPSSGGGESKDSPEPKSESKDTDKKANLANDAFGAALTAAKDVQTSSTPGVLAKVVLPAGVALANAAWHMRPGMEGRHNEAVQKAQQGLQHAEQAYQQNRSFGNAARLVTAKGLLSAAELEKDHPAAVATARGLRDVAATRGAAIYGLSLGTKVKKWVDRASTSTPNGIRNPHAPG